MKHIEADSPSAFRGRPTAMPCKGFRHECRRSRGKGVKGGAKGKS